jgi:predicted alpha/beta hydrolase family esterase
MDFLAGSIGGGFMDCDVLIVPGLWNSGPQHWQSLWESRHPGWMRVQHRDWNNPQRDEWVAELDAAIAACEGAPLLAAHSLGCITIAHWARSGSPLKIAGAFMVAPPDVEAPTCPPEIRDFDPIPTGRLPFPSILVASSNDPYMTDERARALAAAWGSKLVELGEAGHVTSASGYGEWPEGERMFVDLCAQLQR